MRNTSALIHGFKARSWGRERELDEIFSKIKDFFFSQQENNQKLYEAPRFSFLMQAAQATAL